jgi:hypothetical protein
MTLSLATTGHAASSLRDDDKSSVRLTNVGNFNGWTDATRTSYFSALEYCEISSSSCLQYRLRIVQVSGLNTARSVVTFLPLNLFASDVFPIAMSMLFRVRSQSQSTCVRRRFAYSLQYNRNGDHSTVLRKRICVLTFSSLFFFHSRSGLTCNSTRP